jgi:PAS domain S-box-containing protein
MGSAKSPDAASEVARGARDHPPATGGPAFPLASLPGVETSDLIGALLDCSPFAQFVVASDGRIAVWNAAAEALLGYSASEIVGQSSSILMPAHFLGLWAEARQRIRRDKVVSVDSVRRHRGGHLVEVSVTAISIGPADGGSYLIVLQDKRRQREVERENEHLAALVRHSPLAVVGVDPDGIINAWNAAAGQLYGYTAEEAIGQPISIIVPQALHEEAESLSRRLTDAATIEAQTVRRAKNGRAIPVSLISAPISNSSGAVLGRANFYKDITEILHAERTLRESETFARSLIETSPDWIAVLDSEGRIVYQNAPPECGFDPSSSKAQGRQSWLDAWPESQRSVMAECLAAALASGRARTTAMRPQSDGHKRWYDVQLIHLPPIGGARRLLVNARDISERKASDDHISLVNRELSHRAKNLLTVIMAMARSTASEAATASDFTDTFYARLYGLSRSHDLLVSHNWIGADLHNLAAHQLRPFADASSRRLRITGTNILLPPAVAQCLGMAFHELATNSVKYGSLSSSDGRVEIACECRDDGYHITWSEHGGPPVRGLARRGFGAIVVEEMVSDCLDTPARLSFEPSGLVWSATVPLSAGAVAL